MHFNDADPHKLRVLDGLGSALNFSHIIIVRDVFWSLANDINGYISVQVSDK